MLIQVGENEILYDDAVRIRDAATTAGVNVAFESWRHGIHVWPVFISSGLPESAAAIERLTTFFKMHAVRDKGRIRWLIDGPSARHGVRELQLRLGLPVPVRGEDNPRALRGRDVPATSTKGNFNDTRLDGLNWALLLSWPGEVADGNGTQQVIIDERADPAQREGIAQDPSRRVDDPGGDALLRVQQHDVDRAGHAVRAHRAVDRCRSADWPA